MVGNRAKDVSSLLRDVLPDDQDIAADLRAQIQRRHLVRQLATLRNSRKVSQTDVAARLNCKQSRISKLENGFDEDLSLKDIGAYADALQFDVEIVLRNKGATLVDQVKFHAFQIKKCLGRLVELAKNDEVLGKGIKDFHVGIMCDLANMIRNSVAELPQLHESRPHMNLFVQQTESEEDESAAQCENQEASEHATV